MLKQIVSKDLLLYFIFLILGLGSFVFAIIWPETKGFYLCIVSSAIGGLGVASYIFYKKRFNKHLSCPSGSNCDVVIKSKYSTFLKVPLEYWGMVYYSVILLSYLSFLFLPSLISDTFVFSIFLLTTGAFLFSLYLLFVQAFLLKEWCIWCLLSASISILIFISAFISFENLIPVIAAASPALDLIKDLGFILGMGASTVSVFIFFKSLDDFNIDQKELDTIKSFYELIWLGLGLIFISKYASFITNISEVSSSNLFIAEIFSLFVVLIAGAIFKIILSPYLIVLPFKDESSEDKVISLSSIQRLVLVTGAIALSSWYFSFLTNYLPETSINSLLIIYSFFIVIAISISLIWNNKINKEGSREEIKV